MGNNKSEAYIHGLNILRKGLHCFECVTVDEGCNEPALHLTGGCQEYSLIKVYNVGRPFFNQSFFGVSIYQFVNVKV